EYYCWLYYSGAQGLF
nr:immunoglobulin light chain junction region [Macaca mulatta]